MDHARAQAGYPTALRADDVRFGSQADISTAQRHVRFSPNSDRESEFAQKGHVRFTPKSRHVQCTRPCPLWAKSGLMQRSKGLLFDHLVAASSAAECRCFCQPYLGRQPNSLGLFFDLADSRVDLILSD